MHLLKVKCDWPIQLNERTKNRNNEPNPQNNWPPVKNGVNKITGFREVRVFL